MKPMRIQRSRKKGSKLESPNGLPVFCVTRPGRFGNPYATAQEFRDALKQAAWLNKHKPSFPMPITMAQKMNHMRTIARDLFHLRRKNLACWCKPGEPCHADVLLELANAGEHP